MVHRNWTTAERTELVLGILGGSETVAAAAARHCLDEEEVESWREFYLAAARDGAVRGTGRRSGRAIALAIAGLVLAVTVLSSVTGLSQQSFTCGGGGWPSELICFDHNTPAKASEVNGNFKAVVDRMDRLMAPVGSIVGWHKTLGGLSIPVGWVECNGGNVSDTESPINGDPIPDLNGGGRFLRGGSSSGTYQNDAFQGHVHELNSGATIHLPNYDPPNGTAEFVSASNAACTGCSAGYYDQYHRVAPVIGDPVDGTHGTVRVSTETRPTNMSVVWIMRIK